MLFVSVYPAVGERTRPGCKQPTRSTEQHDCTAVLLAISRIMCNSSTAWPLDRRQLAGLLSISVFSAEWIPLPYDGLPWPPAPRGLRGECGLRGSQKHDVMETADSVQYELKAGAASKLAVYETCKPLRGSPSSIGAHKIYVWAMLA